MKRSNRLSGFIVLLGCVLVTTVCTALLLWQGFLILLSSGGARSVAVDDENREQIAQMASVYFEDGGDAPDVGRAVRISLVPRMHWDEIRVYYDDENYGSFVIKDRYKSSLAGYIEKNGSADYFRSREFALDGAKSALYASLIAGSVAVLVRRERKSKANSEQS